ncbi:MAG: homocysteine S-methyltransferase family protein [Pseudomonadota bacterium]
MRHLRQRSAGLPQLDGGLFFTDGGLETDMIFNHGLELPAFAAHTLLQDAVGRAALVRYWRGFLALAQLTGHGFILDCATWRASRAWADALQCTPERLAAANREAVHFAAELRDEFAANRGAIVLNGLIGPRDDAYAPEAWIDAEDSAAYHSEQIGWLASTEVDMVSALTMTHSGEAVGVVRAAARTGLPVVISFTVETDGCLPSGESLAEAIGETDAQTDGFASYFMINCAHPEHFEEALAGCRLARRVRGLRCNASRCSHEALEQATSLDAGCPDELAGAYARLRGSHPWLNVFGGCCGTDLRHITAMTGVLARDEQPLVVDA